MRRGICHSDFLDCSVPTLITNSKSDQGCPLSVLGPFYPFLGGGSDCFLVVLFRLYWVECQLIKEEKKGKDFSEANREMEGDNTVRSKFKRVCVFCGSQSGNRKVFGDAALELGDELVKQKIDLVYGGGSVGLMGLISQKVYDGGCHVLGVIPKALMPLEISGETVGEVQIVLDMHERKAVMAREADAFIALPGGYGTMEEFMEMITWSQLGIHKKPVGLLNVDGYYNSLLGLFDNGVKEGFIKPGAREIVLSAPTARELLEKMENYNPSHKDVAPHESWQVEKLGDYSRK